MSLAWLLATVIGCGPFYGRFGPDDIAEGCSYLAIYRDWVCAEPDCAGFDTEENCREHWDTVVDRCWSQQTYCVMASHVVDCEIWMDDNSAFTSCGEFPGDCAESRQAETCPSDGGEGWH